MAKKKKGTIFDEPKAGPDEEEVGVKNGFLPPEEHEESSEKFEDEMNAGERDTDVYTEEGREELVEDDEVEAWEEEWSEGAEGKGSKGVCAHCSRPLSQEEDEVVEKEIDGEVLWFCSDKCARKGPKKK